MIRLNGKFDVNVLREKCGESRSRIYGFILYTLKDAYVRRVLDDRYFGDSLSVRSGSNWPIFFIAPNNAADDHKWDGYLNYMVSIPRWSLRELSNEEEEIFDFFGLDSNYDSPCFVTFIWGDDNQLRSFVISIDGSSEQSVFKNLSAIVSSITYAESHILEEYKSTDRVFLQVKSNLEALKFKYKVQKFVNKAVPFVEFFSNFR